MVSGGGFSRMPRRKYSIALRRFCRFSKTCTALLGKSNWQGGNVTYAGDVSVDDGVG